MTPHKISRISSANRDPEEEESAPVSMFDVRNGDMSEVCAGAFSGGVAS